MTVAELIEELKKCPQNYEVHTTEYIDGAEIYSVQWCDPRDVLTPQEYIDYGEPKPYVYFE